MYSAGALSRWFCVNVLCGVARSKSRKVPSIGETSQLVAVLDALLYPELKVRCSSSRIGDTGRLGSKGEADAGGVAGGERGMVFPCLLFRFVVFGFLFNILLGTVVVPS